MLLRSWLSSWFELQGWPSRVKHRRDARIRRPATVLHGVEQLEQRRVLATLGLSSLGADGIRILGADASDNAGMSVFGAGDVNGDGIDDIIVGAPYADALNNSTFNAGDVYVIFGGPSLPQTLDLANLGSAGVTISGRNVEDHVGITVTRAGDMNQDGFDDVLIGAAHGDRSGNPDSVDSETYVVFGKSNLPARIDLNSLGSNGVTIVGIDLNDGTSSVSTAGDVNGDGFDDILIGASGGDGIGNTKPDAGEAYLIFGAASMPATLNLASLGSAGATIFGAFSDDGFGYNVAGGGDVDGDGFDDIMITQCRFDIFPGSVFPVFSYKHFLIFGGTSLPSTIDMSNTDTDLTIILGEDSGGSNTGSSTAFAGDLNGDGLDDLLIGERTGNAGDSNRFSTGVTYVIYGAATLPSSINLATPGAASITIFGRDSSDHSGSSVSSAGDVDGDGFDDIVIGAPFADGWGNTNGYAGESYVVFGSPNLPSIIELETLGFDGITIYGELRSDHVASQVAGAGDLNGDGFDDIILGALQGSREYQPAKENSGVAYVVFGGSRSTLDPGAPPARWTKNQAPVALVPQFLVDNTAVVAGSTLTVSLNAVGTKKKVLDQISVPDPSALGSTSGPQFANGKLTLQILLNSNATIGSVQDFIRSITFATKGKGLKTLTRTLEVTLAEPGGKVSRMKQTIQVRKKAS